jgi:histidinol-phosphate aminotransferase
VFGPSPLAVEAMRRAAAECWMYCDPDNAELKAALAARLGIGMWPFKT